MPAWLSPKSSSRAKSRSSAAYLRESQGSSSGCEQHLPPAAGPGKKRSMEPRSANKGKLFHSKATNRGSICSQRPFFHSQILTFSPHTCLGSNCPVLLKEPFFIHPPHPSGTRVASPDPQLQAAKNCKKPLSSHSSALEQKRK